MRFPDCTIHRMPQRSEEWFDIRKGKLTGSQMGAWLSEQPKVTFTTAELRSQIQEFSGESMPAKMTKDELLEVCSKYEIDLPRDFTKGTKDARIKAISKLIGQLSSCEVPDEWEVDPDGPPPKNKAFWAVWNGMRQEGKAVACFEIQTGLEVEEVGFCEHKSGVVGVSPDGLIKGENVGFEGKAPLPETHSEYLIRGVLPETYKAQVHGCMAVTGADAWWFQSYCPGLPTFRILVERDEFTERMKEGIDIFAQELREQTLKILDMIENQKDGGKR